MTQRCGPGRGHHGNAPSPIFVGLVVLTVLGGLLLGGVAGDGVVAARTGIVLLVLGGWAVSLCLHELGHAVVALRGGDTSVRGKGYLRLDPRRYTDPVLSLVVPLALLAFGGIPLPGGAVWIDRSRLRSRWVDSAVSLAGPAVNLVLGVALTVAVASIGMPRPLAAGLSWLALVQLLAFVLNVLPVPGLDGFGVLEPHLAHETRRLAAQVRPFAPFVLFAVLIASPRAAGVLFTVAEWIFALLGGEPTLAGLGSALFLFWR